MTERSFAIRPLLAGDRPQWEALWRAYLAFYHTTLPPATYDHHFARLTAATGDFRALVAVADDTILGLVHFLFHAHGWRPEGTCYLQDLFTTPSARGQGVARALIAAVYAEADARDTPAVYWLTQTGNSTARALYDQVARPTDFMVYRRPL